MNAPDTNLGVGAAEEIRTPPLPADAKTAGGCSGTVNAAALGAADWLCLAAAPTFAIMTLLTGVLGGDMPDMPCSAAQHALPLSGMVPMYLLMSVFHAAPWLKLVSGLRSGARRSRSAPCRGIRFEREGLAIGGTRRTTKDDQGREER